MCRVTAAARVCVVGLVASCCIVVARSANAQVFSNPAAITINDIAPATPYPSTITVSGLTAPIAKVTVTITGFSHAFTSDVDMLLVSPTGAKLVLWSDIGGTAAVTGRNITLDDTAAAILPAGSTLPSGTYRPSNVGLTDPFSAPAPAPAAGDSAAPAGFATLASQFAGTSGNGVWSLYIMDDAGSDVGSISGGWSLNITQATTAPAGALVISEFRLRGPGAANDEFIEIYNASGASHTVLALSGTGYGIAASDGVTRCSIPNNTVIPDRGHFLCASSVAYSLSANATADATFTTDIPDNAGIAIFNNNTGGGSYSLANRLDAVGSTSEANSLYKEGTGYPALTPFSIDYVFHRRLPGGCLGSIGGGCNTLASIKTTPGPTVTNKLQDTGNNANDFVFEDTNGTSAGAGQRLGAPGPENAASPIASDGTTLVESRLDSCVPEVSAPNVVRDFTSDPGNNSTFGTLDVRQTYTNRTGGALTRLRFRVVDITTFPSISGVSDLRPRTSGDVVVTVDRPPCTATTSGVTVHGTTLEQPPSQPNGGGFNSTLSAGSVTTGTPLFANTSIDVRFLLGIQQTGLVRFCIVPETVPASASETQCYLSGTDSVSLAATPGDFEGDVQADMPLYNPVTGLWKILKSTSSYTSSSTISWGGAGYTPVPGDYDGDGVIDLAVYQESTGVWLILKSTSNYTRSLSIPWGGPGYIAVPGDYDGDGVTDPAIYQPATGFWYLLESSTNFTTSRSISWGGTGYTPVPGQDFDGDHRSDLVVYQEKTGTWYVLKSSLNFTTVLTKGWGGVGYTLVPGDYDLDGKADFGIYNRTTGYWYVLLSGASYTTTLAVSWGGPGFLPVPGDYDGDGKADLAYFRPATAQWAVLKSSSSYTTVLQATFGTGAENPISAAIVPAGSDQIHAGDHDGDMQSDITVYDTVGGFWLTLTSSSGYASGTSRGWGGTGYSPVPGDFDGDGLADLGIYQSSTGNWYVLLSGSGFTTVLSKGVGGPGWIPVAGDYDGDGKTDLVVYNTTTGQWYGLKSSTNYTTTINVSWGGSGYTATPGDFDGDGRTDLAIYRGSTGVWSVLTSSSNYTASITRTWGAAGYTPVQGDFDGDGIYDFAVYQASTGTWLVLKSSTGNTTQISIGWGGVGYTPVAGDYDGDGKADLAVYQQSTANWYILLSNGGYTLSLSKNWGGAGYTALPAFP